MEWVDVLDADGNPIVEHSAGEYVPYAFSELIPFFHFPGQKLLCPRQYANQKSVMDECGMGVVGYFKVGAGWRGALRPVGSFLWKLFFGP